MKMLTFSFTTKTTTLTSILVLLFSTQSWLPSVNGYVTIVPSISSSSSSSSSVFPGTRMIQSNKCTWNLLHSVLPQRNTMAIKSDWKKHLSRTYPCTSLALSNDDSSGNNQRYDNDMNEVCDILVLGSGPAGRAIAALLQAANLNVILADQHLDRSFPPNYGVWLDEWECIVQKYTDAAVNLGGTDNTKNKKKSTPEGNGGRTNCIDHQWDSTDCFFGGSFQIPTSECMKLNRPYLRVDRHALRDALTNGYRQIRANHCSTCISPNVYQPANTCIHDETGTTIQLQQSDGTMVQVRTRLVIDCTGHESRLVLRDARTNSHAPGYQIAYGCLVEVEGTGVSESHIGPYNKQAMTLFDYRTDHYDQTDAATQDKLHRSPTFMYAMPLSNNQIFFEETSLVARPALSFQECKDRCYQRLDYHGITVTKVLEEEFCYIPMGGALPAKDQRIVALGGAAAMVHPATGYHLCRCLMGASDLAAVVIQELHNQSSISSTKNLNLDRIAASAYHALWNPNNIRQRNFAIFGGEYLMKQDVVGLRGFFDGFFRLPMPLWAGFLAGWPGLPYNENHESWWQRMWFGVNFLIRLPPTVAIDMVGSIVAYIAFTDLALAQSVTPFLGEPDSFEYKLNVDNKGDVAAKMEARRMILESKVFDDVPVDFEAKTTRIQGEGVDESLIVPDTRSNAQLMMDSRPDGELVQLSSIEVQRLQ